MSAIFGQYWSLFTCTGVVEELPFNRTGTGNTYNERAAARRILREKLSQRMVSLWLTVSTMKTLVQ